MICHPGHPHHGPHIMHPNNIGTIYNGHGNGYQGSFQPLICIQIQRFTDKGFSWGSNKNRKLQVAKTSQFSQYLVIVFNGLTKTETGVDYYVISGNTFWDCELYSFFKESLDFPH